MKDPLNKRKQRLKNQSKNKDQLLERNTKEILNSSNLKSSSIEAAHKADCKCGACNLKRKNDIANDLTSMLNSEKVKV
jgi:hypothetical protein